MAFYFSLSTLLRVRGIVEEQEERALQKILFEISQIRDVLVRTEQQLAGSNASRNSGTLEPFLALNLHASYGELKELMQRRTDLEEQIEKLGKLRDQQLIVYAQARRNREMLTDMRQEKLSAYESELARGEQKTIDDNYIARRGRF